MTSKIMQEIMKSYISRLFESLRLQLLGPQHIKGKAIVFSVRDFDPKTTLASNYLNSYSYNSIDEKGIDPKAIDKIQDVAASYIDSLEKKSLADMTRIIGSQSDNLVLQAKRDNVSIKEVIQTKTGKLALQTIKAELENQKDKIANSVDRLVTHELHNAQNFGALDGILGASKAMGINDPVVFKVLVDDERLCPVCRKLWLSADGITPKLYKLSELQATSPGPKALVAAVAPQHINCRCVLTTLVPGFAFNETGRIVYIGEGHDEYKKQRGQS